MKSPVRRSALLLLLCLASGFGPQLNSSTVIVIGPGIFEDQIDIMVPPPSFAIVDHGFQHQLEVSYRSILSWVGPDGPPAYEYAYESLTPLTGMTVGSSGMIEFLPTSDQSGESYTVDVRITVSDGENELFTDVVGFTTRVIPEAPRLTVSTLSGQPFGAFGNARTKYTYGLDINMEDDDWDLFKFSLINPPTGVFLYENGSLAYPRNEFGEGITEVQIRLRYELETLTGLISDEVEFLQELLPEPPDPSLLGSWNRVGSGSGATFGFSTASDEDWLIVGEPFIADPSVTAPNGSAHLWRIDPQSDDLIMETELLPTTASRGEAFGASVAVRTSENGLPSAAIVGAPEASGGRDGMEPNVGRVDVFEKTDGNWNRVASLGPPEPAANLYTGGWVDLSGEVILASVEGDASAGPFTGALAVYRRDTETSLWEWAQTLIAPDAEAGDYFGYPSVIDGDWIAAAANEDDEAAANAGAVHLFEEVAGSYVHRQKLLSPDAQADALFGERLALHGNWLFVSSIRQDTGAGAVYVFRKVDHAWTFQQRLSAPFISEFSGFGSAFSVRQGHTMHFRCGLPGGTGRLSLDRIDPLPVEEQSLGLGQPPSRRKL